jgi:hypothetical protein
VPDLSIALPSAKLEEEFLRIVDPDGKILAALEALGPVAGRDVIVLDSGGGAMAGRLAELGARVEAFRFPLADDDAARLTGWVGRADTVVVPWSEMASPGSRFLTEATALLRPGGRLLVIHDYGRDDVWMLAPDLHGRMVEWSHRKGPFLGDGYRVRVIHAWWTFDSMDQASEILETVFGTLGLKIASTMTRPKISYSVAIYHRSAPGVGGPDDVEAGTASGLVRSSAL